MSVTCSLTLTRLTDRDLWTRLLPQLMHTEPAVKHLSVALVSITASHSQQPQITGVKPGPNANAEYFENVNKALRRMVGHQPDFDPSMVLPCSLLLALGESLRTGGPFPSLQHVKAGISIVNAWMSNSPNISGNPHAWEDIVQSCKPLFASLVRRATSLGLCEDIFESPWLQKKDVDISHVPAAFLDIHTAALCLDAITSFWVVPLMSQDRYSSSRDPERVQALLDDFLVKYDDFVNRRLRYGPSPIETAKLSILRAGHAASSIIAKCFPSDSEMLFDDMNGIFGEIVQIFQGLIKNSLTQPIMNTGDLRTPTGRIMPLFLTATKCRDTTIRNQALRLLEELNNCSEAAWNSRTAFRIAEAVVSIEAELAQSEYNSCPLEHTRIRLVFAFFDKQGAPEISLSYTRYPHEQSRMHHVKVPLNNLEDISAASQIDWVSRLGLLTTPPFLTDVSPWSIFCRRSVTKASPR